MSAAETVITDFGWNSAATTPDIRLPEARPPYLVPLPENDPEARQFIQLLRGEKLRRSDDTDIDIDMLRSPPSVTNHLDALAASRRGDAGRTVRVKRARLVNTPVVEPQTGPDEAVLRAELEQKIRAELFAELAPVVRREVESRALEAREQRSQRDTRERAEALMRREIEEQAERVRRQVLREEEERRQRAMQAVRRKERERHATSREALERKHRRELESLERELRAELSRIRRRPVDTTALDAPVPMPITVAPTAIKAMPQPPESPQPRPMSPSIFDLVPEAAGLARAKLEPARVLRPFPEPEVVLDEVTPDEIERWGQPVSELLPTQPTALDRSTAVLRRGWQRLCVFYARPNVAYVTVVVASSIAFATVVAVLLFGQGPVPSRDVAAPSDSEAEAALEYFGAALGNGLTSIASSIPAAGVGIAGDDAGADDAGADDAGADDAVALGKSKKKAKKARRKGKGSKAKAARTRAKAAKRARASASRSEAESDGARARSRPAKVKKPGAGEPFALDLPF